MHSAMKVAISMQTEKSINLPLVCVGKAYWQGLFDWMKTTMLEDSGNISPHDLDLIQVFDTADEVVEYINEFYTNKKIMPNF